MSTTKVTGPSKRVFVDTRSVRSVEHVVHQTHQATRLSDPVLVGDMPWERSGVEIYGTVIAEGERLRMWYQPWPLVPPRGVSYLVGYAESTDGVVWDKPNLGIYEFAGSKENNLTNLLRHQPSIIRDPDAPHDERYKGIGHVSSRLSAEQRSVFPESGYYTAYSADGLYWQEYQGANHLAIPKYGDVGSFVRDPYRGGYVGTPKRSHRIGLNTRRSVHLTKSPDFRTWSEPRLVLAADELDDQMARQRGFQTADFYGLCLMPYADFWLGFLWVFFIREPFAKVMLRQSYQQFHRGFGVYGRVEVQLVYSHDGEYWFRAPGRRPFLPWGERGSFDAGGIYTASQPVRYGDELYFYYTGTKREHGSGKHYELLMDDSGAVREMSIGLASMKVDRFMSFSSDGEGMLEVDHGPVAGTTLTVNARCPHGFIKAEVASLDGVVLPGLDRESCLPFTGDSVAGEVRWANGDLSGVSGGDEVLIRFFLYNADLFAYEVR